ncbi:MAG: PaaI family thioesterase [Acidimicrobiia bacterium]
MSSVARSHEWLEPGQLAESARSLSGQQYLEAWANGELAPPMASTLAFRLTDFGEGFVEISCTPDGFHYNPYGTAHGGLAATLLDSATGCAVQSQLPAGVGYATLNLAVSYLRPLTARTGEVRCVGRVVSIGRTVAVSEATLLDPSDKALARATATCLIINPESR